MNGTLRQQTALFKATALRTTAHKKPMPNIDLLGIGYCFQLTETLNLARLMGRIREIRHHAAIVGHLEQWAIIGAVRATAFGP